MAYSDWTLTQFLERFSTEEECLKAVFDARWPHGFVCPKCDHNDGYRLSRRRVVQCCSCRRQSSITAGTIFHRTRFPLTHWFLIIYMVAQDKGGISAKRLAGVLGMHYATAWTMLQKIRIAMGQRDKNLTLAGYIELDEAFFGGTRGMKKGDNSQCQLPSKNQVLVMVEAEGQRAGNISLTIIPDATFGTLKRVIEQKVESDPPVSHFHTDALQAHDVLRWLGNKLEMEPIPQTSRSDKFPCLSLALVHLRRFLLGTHHQFCKKHLQRYLDEFAYRWNRRNEWHQIFNRLVTACSLSEPTSNAALS